MVRIYLMALLIFACQSQAKDRCIMNFNKLLCNDFTPGNAVIIKSHLDKDSLQKALGVSVTQLAFLHSSNLYLKHSDNSMLEANQLNKLPYVEYAQPDIVQERKVSKMLEPPTERNNNIVNPANKGKGVKIAIIDDGFNFEHEDLQGVDVVFSYDADNKNLDVFGKSRLDKHGTLVAGLIFAQHNEMGIDGIAPEASLIAIRQPLNRTSDTVLSFTVAAKAGADIINCSWHSPRLMEPVFDVITDLAKYGRQGKGIAVVFAAGNQNKEILPLTVEPSIPEVITVATDKNYSNHGDVVDIVSPTSFHSTVADGSYGKFGGTSASASYVSGKIALWMADNPDKDLKQLQKELKKIVYQ